jgi:chromosome segregation ATPase
MKELEGLRNNLKEIERKILKIREKIMESEDEMKDLEAEEAPLRQNIEEHNQELLNVTERKKEIKMEIARIYADLRQICDDEISRDIKDQKITLKNVSDRIDAEKRRIENDTA